VAYFFIFMDRPVGYVCKQSVHKVTRSSATAEKQRVSCPHGGG